jgi:hypothetical protein
VPTPRHSAIILFDAAIGDEPDERDRDVHRERDPGIDERQGTAAA